MQELKNSDRRVYDSRKYKIRLNKKDIVIKKLISQGFKITKQRMMLLNIILNEECSNCKEIHYKASKINKKIGIATVYRMINLLESVGVISKENMYKFSCESENNQDCIYEIKFDDNTVYKISAEEWNNVVIAGLNVCGYAISSNDVIRIVKNQNVERINKNHDVGGK